MRKLRQYQPELAHSARMWDQQVLERWWNTPARDFFLGEGKSVEENWKGSDFSHHVCDRQNKDPSPIMISKSPESVNSSKIKGTLQKGLSEDHRDWLSWMIQVGPKGHYHKGSYKRQVEGDVTIEKVIWQMQRFEHATLLAVKMEEGGIAKMCNSKSRKRQFTCQCRRHGFDPWSGKIPHFSEQLGQCTTTEPVLWSPGASTMEA